MTSRDDQPQDLLSLAELAATRALTTDELDALNNANYGLDRNLGLRYTTIEPGRVVSELHVASKHLQVVGLVNGGVYAAIAESTGSVASMISAPGKMVVGINNNTDFISAVSSGVIVAEATPIQLGGRTHLWQIECTHRGEVVARTTLRTMVLNK